MENNQTQNSISLKEMWGVFASHAWQILVIGLVLFVLVATYGAVTYSPVYESVATIYILPRSDGGMTTGDLSIAINTFNDCTEILTSNKVFEEVKENLGMNITYSTFKSMVSITNKEESRVLYVSIMAPSPMDSKIIVDELCKVGAEQIVSTMGVDQVNLVDYGTFNEVPANSRFSKMSLVIGIAAALLAYGIYLILYVMDDNINIPDDVEKYLGVQVLGIIPYSENGTANKSSGNVLNTIRKN